MVAASENIEHVLWRSSDAGPTFGDDDRSFDELRVVHHRLEELAPGVVRVREAEFCEGVFALSHEVPRLEIKQLDEVLQLARGRWRL